MRNGESVSGSCRPKRTESPLKPSVSGDSVRLANCAARRRGVGMFILDKADQIARAGGRSSIRADVYELNGPMQNLLEKHGYSLG